MKTLNKNDDIAEIIFLFSEIQNIENKFLVWQLDESSGKRNIHVAKLTEFGESDNIDFEHFSGGCFDFSKENIYFFNKKKNSLFKSKPKLCEASFLSVDTPLEIKVLDDKGAFDLLHGLFQARGDLDSVYPELKEVSNMATQSDESFNKSIDNESKDLELDYNASAPEGEEAKKKGKDYHFIAGSGERISTKWSSIASARDKSLLEEELSFSDLDAEDEFYKDKRDAPRARPKINKSVKLKKLSSDQDEDGKVFSLFDLSRGGLSAVIDDEKFFTVEEIVLVLGFDDKSFDTPIEAIVRSVRELAPGQFKLGMQFQESLE